MEFALALFLIFLVFALISSLCSPKEDLRDMPISEETKAAWAKWEQEREARLPAQEHAEKTPEEQFLTCEEFERWKLEERIRDYERYDRKERRRKRELRREQELQLLAAEQTRDQEDKLSPGTIGALSFLAGAAFVSMTDDKKKECQNTSPGHRNRSHGCGCDCEACLEGPHEDCEDGCDLW